MLRSVPVALVTALLVLSGLAGCQHWSQRTAHNPFRRDAERPSPAESLARSDDNLRANERGAGAGRFTPDEGRGYGAGRRNESSIRRQLDGQLAELPAAEREEIAQDLAGLDPATAQMVLRTIQRARSMTPQPRDASRTTLASRGIPRGSAGIRTAGGRVLDGEVPVTDTNPPSRRPQAQQGLGAVSAWGDDAADEQVADAVQPRRTLKPPSQFAETPSQPRVELIAAEDVERPSARPAIDRRPAEPFGAPGTRSPGRRPTATSNGQPRAVAELPVRETASPGDPWPAPSTAEPAGDLTDRSMSSNFTTSAPGARPTVELENDTPYGPAIRHLEQRIQSIREHGDLSAVEQQQLFEDEVFLRLVYLADGQEDRATEPVDGLSPEEKQFWTNTLWALTNYFDVDGIENPSDRTGQVLVQLRAAVRALQSKARLELRNVNLCRVVRSFGDYEPLDSNELAARQKVIVYAEVENFRSTMTDTGDFVTNLLPRIEFYREGDGSNVVEKIEFDETIDYSRNHRRDYFLVFEFNLPADLSPGRYTMVLQVDDGAGEDSSSGRVVTRTLKFRVAG